MTTWVRQPVGGPARQVVEMPWPTEVRALRDHPEGSLRIIDDPSARRYLLHDHRVRSPLSTRCGASIVALNQPDGGSCGYLRRRGRRDQHAETPPTGTNSTGEGTRLRGRLRSPIY